MPVSDGAAEVVVVGSLNVDLFVHAPRLPRPGETLIGTRFATDQGGKGANQAVAAARLGARVAMLGRVGRDAHGQRMLEALRREGIAVDGVGEDATEPTGVAAISVAADGENCIVVVPGANHAFGAAQVEAHAAVIAAARIVVLQLETPMAAVTQALRLARAAGVATLLNAAPAAELSAEQLALIDWLVVNEGEAAQLLGAPVVAAPEEAVRTTAQATAQAGAAAQALRARGPRHVVVTLGAAGLVHASAAGVLALGAPRVTAIDTTGAGDTFVGVFAAGLARGLAAPDALRWGLAAAALAVTRHGTQSAMPTRAELVSRWPDPDPVNDLDPA